ncbi:MAG: rhodanese-like domain-containing protein [Pseudomonadota bacterium]
MTYPISRRRGLAILGAAALLAGGGATRPADAADGETGASHLSAEEAYRRAKAGELILIDVRRPEEWAATGSGEGAVRLDMRRPDFVTELQRLVSEDPNRPIAMICARGNRSAWVSAQLAHAGFGTVLDVSEGMLGSQSGPGWLARGLPVIK